MRRILSISLFLLLTLILAGCTHELEDKMGAYLDQVEEGLADFNTHDVKDMEKTASWFERHGDTGQQARALYCLGRTQFNAGSYSAAIVSYTRALELAGQAGDKFHEGLICRDMARTCNASGNTTDEMMYLARAAEAFQAAGKRQESLRSLLEIGQAEAGLARYDAAEDIFKSVLYDSHELKDTLLEARCLESYAALAVGKDTPDPALAIDLLGRAGNELGLPLSSSDKGVLAYSYSLMGRQAEALKWLSEARAEAEGEDALAEVDFREYQIASRSGDSRKALQALEKVTEYGNRTQTAALREAVAASQREYIQEKADATAQGLRNARLKLWLFSLAALMVIAALVAAYLYHRALQKRRLEEEIAEKEQIMNVAEDLRRKLASSSRAQKPGRGEGLRYDVLERLCEQYYVYEGTDNLQPKILKEVRNIVEGLRSDRKVQRNLEEILDADCDGVMTKLREEFPSWKEEDFLLYSFAASGFSSTTISTLMGKEKSVIYNRIWRLKGRISNSDSPLKEFFLSCLGK